MKGFFVLLVIVLFGACIWAGGAGALGISPEAIFGIICKKLGIAAGSVFTQQQENVFWIIRLPRVAMAMLIGATLAVCGAAMQGLFRNPLADPALIGISASASATTVLMIVLGARLFAGFESLIGQYSLNISTFSGALLATFLVYRIARQKGKTNVSIMLLGGIAINALAGALTSLVTLSANDQQLRSVTFWMMGSLGGANWISVAGILPFCMACIAGIPFLSRQLNAFSLGESDAGYLGIRVERLKNTIIVLCAMGTGASVAVSGVIGFVGLVVPHIVRMIIGPEHKKLVIGSALMGAILLIMADLISRTIAGPVEIPIGIITALGGGPFFLYLLLKEKSKSIL